MHAIDMVILGTSSFMVAGLSVPVLAALFWPRVSSGDALWSIVAAGTPTIGLTLLTLDLRGDPVFFGTGASAVVLISLTLITPARVAGGG